MNRPTADQIRSIYSQIDQVGGLPVDESGWNSHGALFGEIMNLLKPEVGIEVGVFNGASVLTLCRESQKRGLRTLIYAVDVYFGHVGDGIGQTPASQIPTHWSRPTREQQFLKNVKAAGFDDRVIPVVNFTSHGAKMLKHWGVVADFIYVDASHTEEGVYGDATDYWDLLRPGGIMGFDDLGYPTCLAGIAKFGNERNLPLEIVGGQGYYKKP